jgi:hypothetical protein
VVHVRFRLLIVLLGLTVKPKTLRKVAHKRLRAKQNGRAFEQAMARMAADPAIQAECAAIANDFRIAESDGLDA